MNAKLEAQNDISGPAHERIFRSLRNAIMWGEIPPGQSLTLRGVADAYGASMTPAREALRRLTAEGAIRMTQTGRYATNALTPDRVEELATLRGLSACGAHTC